VSYLSAVGLLAIDVRDGTSFPLIDHLEGAFPARAWAKSDIGPDARIGRASLTFALRQSPYQGFLPRLIRQS
jgi:hypothetical protein